MLYFVLRWRRIVVGLLSVIVLIGVVIAIIVGTGAIRLSQRVNGKDAAAIETMTPRLKTREMMQKNAIQEPSLDCAIQEPSLDCVDYRIERESRRSERLEILREIAAEATTGDSTRQKAQEKLMALAGDADQESRIENLLRAKGFGDAVVAIEDQGVTVVVPGMVGPDQNATVINLVCRSLGVGQERVMVLGRE